MTSEQISSEELRNEIVYFAQIRTNNQITLPKECMEAKKLKPGDVIAIAILKIVDGTVTFEIMRSRLGGGEKHE